MLILFTYWILLTLTAGETLTQASSGATGDVAVATSQTGGIKCNISNKSRISI